MGCDEHVRMLKELWCQANGKHGCGRIRRGKRRGEGGMKYKGQQVKDVSRWCVASSGVVNSQKMEKEELAAISTNVMLTQLMLR